MSREKKKRKNTIKTCCTLSVLTGDDVPVLASLLASQRHHETLGGDDGNLVDGVQDQVEDALLLEQVLAVSEGTEGHLAFVVLCRSDE